MATCNVGSVCHCLVIVIILTYFVLTTVGQSFAARAAAAVNQHGWHDWYKIPKDSAPSYCYSNISEQLALQKVPLSLLFEDSGSSEVLLAGAFERYNHHFFERRHSKYRLWSSIRTALNDQSEPGESQHGQSALGYGIAIELIWKNQHPKDCSTAKFLIAPPHDGGFGSEIHTHAATFALGINLNRVVLLHPNVSSRLFWQVTIDFCRNQNTSNLDCYYEPWSSCTLENALGRNWTMKSLHHLHGFTLKHQHKLFQFNRNFSEYANLYHENQVNHQSHKALMMQSLIGDHNLFPYKLIKPLRCYKIQESFYHYWWRAIVTTYIIRPNRKSLDWLESLKSHVDITPRDLSVSIYIRRADKVLSEMEFVLTNKYVDAAVSLLQLPVRTTGTAREASNRSLIDVAIGEGRRIVFFIGSEDDQVIADAEKQLFLATNKTQRLSKFKDFHVRYTSLFNRSTQVAKLGLFASEHTPKDHFHHDSEYLSMLLNLQLSTRSDGWVCTLKSNWSFQSFRSFRKLGAKLSTNFAPQWAAKHRVSSLI